MKNEVIITASAAPVVTHEVALKIIEAILADDDVGVGEMVGYGTELFSCMLIRKDKDTVPAVFGNQAEVLAAKDACTGEKMNFPIQQISVDLS